MFPEDFLLLIIVKMVKKTLISLKKIEKFIFFYLEFVKPMIFFERSIKQLSAEKKFNLKY